MCYAPQTKETSLLHTWGAKCFLEYFLQGNIMFLNKTGKRLIIILFGFYLLTQGMAKVLAMIIVIQIFLIPIHVYTCNN